MASTGFTSPTANDAVKWTNPNNAHASDDAYAGTVDATDRERYHTFNFSIPAGSVITGLQIRIEAHADVTNPSNLNAGATWNAGSNWVGTSTTWATGADTSHDLDIFALGFHTWVPDDFSNANFKIRSGQGAAGNTLSVDHIQVNVDYDLTANSERAAKTTGKLTSNSERAAKVTGIDERNYSKEAKASLPATAADLQAYTLAEYEAVDSDNNVYAALNSGIAYAVHLFKKQNDNETDEIAATIRVKSDLAPSVATVFLQVYNFTTTTWETVDSDNATAANTEFDLTASITVDRADYYDADNIVAFRVYQEGAID